MLRWLPSFEKSKVSPSVDEAIDVLTTEELKTLRNRAEDQLRKSPSILKKVLRILIRDEDIRYKDILKE